MHQPHSHPLNFGIAASGHFCFFSWIHALRAQVSCSSSSHRRNSKIAPRQHKRCACGATVWCCSGSPYHIIFQVSYIVCHLFNSFITHHISHIITHHVAYIILSHSPIHQFPRLTMEWPTAAALPAQPLSTLRMTPWHPVAKVKTRWPPGWKVAKSRIAPPLLMALRICRKEFWDSSRAATLVRCWCACP